VRGRQNAQLAARAHKRRQAARAMAAPPAPVARPGVLTVKQIKPAGLRHDARLQDVLHAFCVTSDGPAGIREWLAPEEPRPLWQLGVVAMALNGGIVMMTDGGDHDALHMACEADLLSALAEPAAPCAPALPAPLLRAPAEPAAPCAPALPAPLLSAPAEPAALLSALAEPAAPHAPALPAPLPNAVDADARTPYEYGTDEDADDGSSSFERELAGLSLLTKCAGR